MRNQRLRYNVMMTVKCYHQQVGTTTRSVRLVRFRPPTLRQGRVPRTETKQVPHSNACTVGRVLVDPSTVYTRYMVFSLK